MRILHTVEFYSPSVGGAQEVVRQISEQLVRRGHEVTVATTALSTRTEDVVNGVRVVGFNVSGNAVHGFNGEIERYQSFLLESKFDVMLNYAAQQWTADLVFPVLSSFPYPRVLAPCGFSGLYRTEYQPYFADLPHVLKQYDALVFHSDSYRDIDFARHHGIENYVVIPNGASEEEFAGDFTACCTSFRQKYHISPDTPMLLTVGSHTGMKGHEVAIEAFRRARIGAAVLVVIGNTLWGPGCLPECRKRALTTRILSLGQKRVLLLDPPRTEVVAAYHAADLFVFGSRIECSPLVLFEAAASGTPFVTSCCGNSAEIATWTGAGVAVPSDFHLNGMVSADPRAMAQAIEEIVADGERRHRMGEAGRVAWKERFTWERIASEYEVLYQQVVASHSHQVVSE